jgi:flagellin-like hook-associated protein FlgL
MSSIIGIPTTRVSDVYIRQRMLNQVQSDLANLYRIQVQLSTGHQFQKPSEDPVAASEAMRLQRTLERYGQVQNNLKTNQSYLSASNAALSNVSDLLAGVRSAANGVLGNTSSDDERQTVVQQIGQTLQHLVQIGNQRYRNQYLFSGSEAASAPFAFTGSSLVEYFGNSQSLYSYSDISQVFRTNITGDEVFGATSTAVEGTAVLQPTLSLDTPLADLRQGQGISRGSIEVSDGIHAAVTIDLSGAKTIGDVAALIKSNAPAGRDLYVDVAADKLIVQLDAAGGGTLSIREVGSGTVADELGIRCETGAGTDPVIGRPLDPVLRGTSRLTQLCGAYASAVVHSRGADNDIRLTADAMGDKDAGGADLNGVRVEWVADPGVDVGGEYVEYDPGVSLKVHVAGNGMTRADRVVEVLNDAHDAGDIPFTAEIDPLDDTRGGINFVESGAWARTRDGAGEAFDQQSGLRIVNQGKQYTISLQSAQTLEDVLNVINGSGAGVRAEINAAKNGINLRSQCSGCDFTIGENGGATAAQLGVRSMSQSTPLSNLNFGQGVRRIEGVDFTVTRSDGKVLSISLGDAQTVGDVLDLINNDPNNADGLLTARLAKFGNGIELIDLSDGKDNLVVKSSFTSYAAADLGLVPSGADHSNPGKLNSQAILPSTAPDGNVRIAGRDPAFDLEGVQVVFDASASGVAYNETKRILTVGIEAGVTTAADVAKMINDSPAGAWFEAFTDPPGSTGSGAVDPTSGTLKPVAGGHQALTGADANPQEVDGVFTALVRLKAALENNNLAEAQRAVNLLDRKTVDLNYARSEIGLRQQNLDTMSDRIDSENTELQGILSRVYDADMVDVISQLSARQATYQASLQSIGKIYQMTLLNYL